MKYDPLYTQTHSFFFRLPFLSFTPFTSSAVIKSHVTNSFAHKVVVSVFFAPSFCKHNAADTQQMYGTDM